MSACERCWSAAFLRAKLRGGHQADHYRDLLAEAARDGVVHPAEDHNKKGDE